ncbi:MAG: Rieske 2Fe-2S domain-containing protein [Ferrovibrio sp.]|nr:Rieske 2Fe-2S domain-containing protein [Ferrovibrio sp.]
MDQATQTAWLSRTLKHIEGGTTDQGEVVTRIAVQRYIDPDFLARERDTVFRNHPIAVSFSSKLAKPGDFVTHDHLGLPLLLLRGRDGQVHAYLNVCRHRGARLVTAREGCGRHRFTCPYHAWTYDDAGTLLSLPHEAGFGDLDKGQHGLVRLPVAEAFGVVFVLPRQDGDLDLDKVLGPLKHDMVSFGLSDHVVYDEREIGLRCNWKVVIEGGLETYHVRHAHGRTIAPMFLDNVSVMERFDPHARLYFTKREAAKLKMQALDGLRVRDFGNPLYFFFPNLIVLVQPDHATVMITSPQGTDACMIQGAALIPEPALTEKARAHWDKNVKIFWDALDEDFQMGQSIQAGFRSGANSHITFGRFEHPCGWFHAALDKAMTAGAMA